MDNRVTSGEQLSTQGGMPSLETAPALPAIPQEQEPQERPAALPRRRGPSGGGGLPPPPDERKHTSAPEYDSRTEIILKENLGAPLVFEPGNQLKPGFSVSGKTTIVENVTLPASGHIVEVHGPFRTIPDTELTFKTELDPFPQFTGYIFQALNIPKGENVFLFFMPRGKRGQFSRTRSAKAIPL